VLKKSLKLGVAVLAALWVVGCSRGAGGPGSTPEETARAFLEAGKKGSAGKETGYACFTDKARKIMEALEAKTKEFGKSGGLFSDENKLLRYTIGEVKREGDRAVVTVTTVTLKRGKEEESTGQIAMRLEGGVWKVYGFGDRGQITDLEAEGDKMLRSLDMMRAMKKKMEESIEKKKQAGAGKTVAPPAPAVQEAMKKAVEELKKKLKEEGRSVDVQVVPPSVPGK